MTYCNVKEKADLNAPEINQAKLFMEAPCLAIDTSNAVHEVWLFTHHGVYHQSGRPEWQNRHLLKAVQMICRQADILLEEIKLFAYHCGPGSLTRLRIGTAVARTMAYAFKKPTVGLSAPFLQVLRVYAENPTSCQEKVWSVVPYLDQVICWGVYACEKGVWFSIQQEQMGARRQLEVELLEVEEELVLLGYTIEGSNAEKHRTYPQGDTFAKPQPIDFGLRLSKCIQCRLGIDLTRWIQVPIYPHFTTLAAPCLDST